MNLCHIIIIISTVNSDFFAIFFYFCKYIFVTLKINNSCMIYLHQLMTE